jgi:hypothetical protein
MTVLYLHHALFRLIAVGWTLLLWLLFGRRSCARKNFSLKTKPAYQPARPHSKPPWIQHDRPHSKPPWIQHEVLRLKALMPQGTGVRKIAATFNRMHAHHIEVGKRQCISKTYVAEVIKNNMLEVHRIRHQVRTRAPGPHGQMQY